MEIVSFAQYGYTGEIVKVEADLRRGIPAIDIVGLPDGAVREARERMRAAIRNSGLDFPRERILINLSPADLKKEGSSFDLPIALAVLNAAEKSGLERGDHTVMVLGELELSGAVRPVRGVLAAVSLGLEQGIRCFIVPRENVEEAGIRKEACVIGVESVAEAVHRLDALRSGIGADGAAGSAGAAGGKKPYAPVWNAKDTPGFEDVRGQHGLVRALEIAAAGGHHLIAYGPPGCGKTLALKRYPVLLPEMDEKTAVTVTRIHSLGGILPPKGAAGSAGQAGSAGDSLVRESPFREPHQSASLEGMIGGGKNCRPGEISFAHGGVLFLDESAQFRASVLQALRVPLETGEVTISRAGLSFTFPSRFQLLMAVNPCPCGNFGSEGRICTCTPETVERYWKKMTAPLLDRIDLRVPVAIPAPEDLVGGRDFSTAKLREEISRARRAQWERNGDDDGKAWQNAHLGPEATEKACALDAGARGVFTRSMKEVRLSGRGGHGILKVARTIADLEECGAIREEHILEAAHFRKWSSAVPDFL